MYNLKFFHMCLLELIIDVHFGISKHISISILLLFPCIIPLLLLLGLPPTNYIFMSCGVCVCVCTKQGASLVVYVNMGVNGSQDTFPV